MSPFGTTAESRRRRATVLPRSMTNGCTRAVVAISAASSSASKRRSWLRPSSTASRPRLSASLTSRSWPAWSQAAASSSVWVARTTAAPSPAAARLAGRRLSVALPALRPGCRTSPPPSCRTAAARPPGRRARARTGRGAAGTARSAASLIERGQTPLEPRLRRGAQLRGRRVGIGQRALELERGLVEGRQQRAAVHDGLVEADPSRPPCRARAACRAPRSRPPRGSWRTSTLWYSGNSAGSPARHAGWRSVWASSARPSAASRPIAKAGTIAAR